MKWMHPRFLLLWALVLLPVAAAVWYLGGPFVLQRSVEVPLNAKSAASPSSESDAAGPSAHVGAWPLEWADTKGTLINGRWLELTPQDNGNIEQVVESVVPNYEFSTLVLRWRGLPGIGIAEPVPATLVERVLGVETRTQLRPRPDFVPEVTLDSGMLRSRTGEGGIAWKMPAFTLAQAQDILVGYVAILGVGLFLWTAFHLRDGSGWYTPERAALAVVVVVHVWMALRAPLLYCPDSMDYAVNAKELLETHSLEHFNGWRLPGYSVFLAPFVGALHKYNFALGLVQAILGVLTAWMASRAVQLFLSPAWGALALLIVGLDPVLLMYERHAMPECLSAFVTMLGALIALQGRFWATGSLLRACFAAVGVGLLLGASSYIRGNLLIVGAAAPFVIASWPLAEGLRTRAAVLLATTLLVVVGVVAPWFVVNHRKYERAEFVVGSGFTRTQSMSEAWVLDLNQSVAFTPEQWEQLKAAREKGGFGWVEVMNELKTLNGTALAARTQNLPAWTQLDERAKVLARESVARDPEGRWKHSGRAVANLLGIYPADQQENNHWSGPLRRFMEDGRNHRVKPEDFGHLKAEYVQDIYDRTLADTSRWSRTDQARAFDHLWVLAATLRPVWALLFIVGTVCALGRRQWALFLVGSMAIAHALYLGVVLLTGIDRYQAPMYPVMSVLAIYGIACLAGVAPMSSPLGNPAGRSKVAAQPSSRTGKA